MLNIIKKIFLFLPGCALASEPNALNELIQEWESEEKNMIKEKGLDSLEKKTDFSFIKNKIKNIQDNSGILSAGITTGLANYIQQKKTIDTLKQTLSDQSTEDINQAYKSMQDQFQPIFDSSSKNTQDLLSSAENSLIPLVKETNDLINRFNQFLQTKENTETTTESTTSTTASSTTASSTTASPVSICDNKVASWCKTGPCLNGEFKGSQYLYKGECKDTPQNTFAYQGKIYDCTPDLSKDKTWKRYRNIQRTWDTGQCCEKSTAREKCFVPKEVGLLPKE